MKFPFAVFLSVLMLTGCMPPESKMSRTKKTGDDSVSLISNVAQEDLSKGKIKEDTPSIKVALLVPLSGESAAVGNAMFDAATLALHDSYLAIPSEEIKAQIVLMPKDTGSTSGETVKVVEQAIEQGAQFVIGPLFSQSVTAIKPTLKEKNIPMLSFSNNKDVAEPKFYTFGFLPEQQVERIAEYAYLNKLQRVALLASNDAYGEKIRDSLIEVYTKKGGQVMPAELFAPSQANIDAAVSRIAGAYNNAPEDRRFQAIFVANGAIQMKNILKSIRKNNLDLKKIKLLGTGVWDDEDLAKIPEMNGAVFPSSPPELYDVFEKRFVTTYGYKPVRLASLAYDAVTIVSKVAMENNGISVTALTNPNGFNTPAGGLVRLLATGSSDRKLAIMEVTPDGFKVLDKSQKNFSLQ